MENLTPEEQRHVEELRHECGSLWELCLVQMKRTNNLPILEMLLRIGHSFSEQMQDLQDQEQQQEREVQRKRLRLLKK